MAQYDITKKLTDAGVTAAEVNAALATSPYNHPIHDAADSAYARSSRDYDRVMAYLAKLAADKAAETVKAAPVAGSQITERQISFIMSLLGRRERSGEAGGFMAGPTTREGVARLTRNQASSYIDSLTGRY